MSVKIGTENKKQVIAAVVLMAIAVPLALYTLRGFFAGGNASAAPSVPAVASSARPGGGLPAQDSSDPRLRLDTLEASRRVKLETGGRNIFTMEADIPKVEGQVRAQNEPWTVPQPPTPTPTPPPPPIPIKYYGFASKPGETKKVFLQQQGVEDVWVVRQGDIVGRRYRLVQISSNSVTMEDVLTSNRQSIPLTIR
jgi:hypothetical protein